MKLNVVLNGTATNPWHRLGLTQNPFPQTAKYEEDRRTLALQKLGGDPIPNTDYIRSTLVGFSDEFVNLCCERFVPGELVRFSVEYPD